MDPLSFTHAGVYDRPSNQSYTAHVQERHEAALEQIRLKKKYNIFLGEFSVSIHNSLSEREKYYVKTIKFANANCVGWAYLGWSDNSPGAGYNHWDPAGIKIITNEIGDRS